MLPTELADLLSSASSLAIVDDNARRPQFSATEAAASPSTSPSRTGRKSFRSSRWETSCVDKTLSLKMAQPTTTTSLYQSLLPMRIPVQRTDSDSSSDNLPRMPRRKAFHDEIMDLVDDLDKIDFLSV